MIIAITIGVLFGAFVIASVSTGDARGMQNWWDRRT
jgi:hypothetical protein